MENNGTLKVAQIADHRPATSATHVITYVLDGFAITSTIETTTPIRQVVDRLKAIGAEPPTKSTSVSTDTEVKSPPTCPVHHSEMKSGRRGFFCPKKVGDGYCRETA